MNKQLTEKYVAFKMAQMDAFLAEIKKVTSERKFINYALSLQASELPPSFKKELEERLRRRFGLKKHDSVFYKPTVHQWLADLTCQYSAEDVIASFSQLTGLGPHHFLKSTVCQVLDRAFLLDVIELFEEATDKHIIKDGNITYLGDNFTYWDLAEFFSCDNTAV